MPTIVQVVSFEAEGTLTSSRLYLQIGTNEARYYVLVWYSYYKPLIKKNMIKLAEKLRYHFIAEIS